MAEEKKYDDISPASESIQGETTNAKVMPLYADERGYHEKDAGFEDNIVIRAAGKQVCCSSECQLSLMSQSIDPNTKDGAVQRNLKSRHVAMVSYAILCDRLPNAHTHFFFCRLPSVGLSVQVSSSVVVAHWPQVVLSVSG
jgi:hypothetical protein